MDPSYSPQLGVLAQCSSYNLTRGATRKFDDLSLCPGNEGTVRLGKRACDSRRALAKAGLDLELSLSVGPSQSAITCADLTAVPTLLQTTKSPAACTSGFVRSPKQRRSSTKSCSYAGCAKGARGSSGRCIRHGGGRRCKSADCNKSAQGSTNFCKKHGGGRRCLWGHPGSDLGVDSPPCEHLAARGKKGLCGRHNPVLDDDRVHGGQALSSFSIIGNNAIAPRPNTETLVHPVEAPRPVPVAAPEERVHGGMNFRDKPTNNGEASSSAPRNWKSTNDFEASTSSCRNWL